MKKFLIILLTLVVVAIVGLPLFKKYTKSHSPPAEARYQKDSLLLKVDYCRPAAKGRVIFGEKSAGALQPYSVSIGGWAPTRRPCLKRMRPCSSTARSSRRASIRSMRFRASTTWTIAFNSDWNRWGAMSPDAAKDVLRVDVPVNTAADKKENFEISFEDPDPAGTAYADLHWDKSLVRIPFKKK